MRKFIQTLFLTLTFVLSSYTTNTFDNSEKIQYLISKETPESLHVMQTFGVHLIERELISQYPAICPIPEQDGTYLSSPYGQRMHPVYKRNHVHTGVDIAAPKGHSVIATGNGTVTCVKTHGGYGNQIMIEHADDYYTRYAHLSKILVSKGDIVQAGDTIGNVGSTGLSTGNHLHYEIIHHNKTIDPMSIYPDTLRKNAYLDYSRNLNDHFKNRSDFLFNI